jgi:hypothetical protein
MKNTAKPVEYAAMRRASHRQWILKPQDLVVALKLHLLGTERVSFAVLGKELRLSPFEAHAATQRLIAARLAAPLDGQVMPILPSLRSFLLNGAPFTYPAVRGEITVGMPTAHAAPPLNSLLVIGNELPPVWPDPEGTQRGGSVMPLYPRVTEAARSDTRLYAMLALFDALRVGQARERTLAIEHLEMLLQ